MDKPHPFRNAAGRNSETGTVDLGFFKHALKGSDLESGEQHRTMARITVEDCLEKTTNRFELVLLAAKRARQLSRGALPLVDEEDDKPTVLALREIASAKISPSLLKHDDDDNEGDYEEDHFGDSHLYPETTMAPSMTDGNDNLSEGNDGLPDEEFAERKFMEEMEKTQQMEEMVGREEAAEYGPDMPDDAPCPVPE